MVAGDWIAFDDAGVSSKALISAIPLSIFNNDSSWISDIVQDTSPQLGGMLDVNGQSIGDGTLELIKFVETGSAINEITITNAAAAGSPTISATGDDANIDLSFASKGTGQVKSLDDFDVTGDVTISGSLTAQSKSFKIDHPTKPGKKLVYGSLEGPEFAIYERGRLKGSDMIILPDYWKKLVDWGTITVQLTVIYGGATVAVGDIDFDNHRIEVKRIGASKLTRTKIDCYYTVSAERKDIPSLLVEE
jgi:hypothetical protein